MEKQDVSKTDRILLTLGEEIVSGQFAAGQPLPAEVDLCERFATSRNIIREVYRSLTAKRLIEIKRYRGAFITPHQHWNFLDSDVLQWSLKHNHDPKLIAAMNDVRVLVEPQLARWSAERASAQDLAAIEQALNEMIARRDDRDAFNEADMRYHEALLTSVHNPILQQLSIALVQLQKAVFARTYRADRDNMPQTLREHQNLFDAIRHQDSDAAEAAARAMIASSTQRLKEVE